MKKTFYSRIIIIPLLVQILSVSVTPGQDFTYSLGNRDALINEAAVPVFTWFPDGHIPVLAEPDNEKHIMYWPEYENYRTLGDFPFPEYQYTLSPEEPVFGGRLGIERWDNGGSWLMSVFRQEGDKFLAAVPCEDIRAAQLRRTDFGDLFQDQVADIMPVGIVHLLEVIDVDQDGDERLIIAAGTF